MDVEAASAAAPVEKALSVRPTLFVGLGGTGMEILLRVRRRILQQSWGPDGDKRRLASMAEFPVAAFLYFDTDTNEARESDRSAVGDSLAAAVQFAPGETLQKKIDVQYYTREMQTKPLVREWFPSADLSRIDTEKGAGQVRAISRLLFFDVYSRFRNAVQQSGSAVLANVENQDRLRRLSLVTQPDLRIVVVASTAGGTGSGSFIDVGFALKEMRIGGKSPQVDLFLMLPGGYVGANQERVFANTYAALSELEHVVRPSHRPRYVSRWVEHQEPVKAEKPYDEVYLFDVANIASQITTSPNHVFDMVADILAEDFSSSDFARRKRSISVNQQQHKSGLYYPDMPSGVGARAIGFSRLYSSIGQTILASTGSLEHEGTIAKAGMRMLQAYFGVATGAAGNQPTPDERDEFMAENMLLGMRTYAEFSGKLRDRPRPILEYAIVDELVRRDSGESIAARLREEIERKINAIRTDNPDIRSWEAEAERVYRDVSRDVGGHMESGEGVGPRGAEVRAAAARLTGEFLARSGERSLSERFYRRLDHVEKGGFDYTVRLIELVKEQIELVGEGVVSRLSRAQDEYQRLAGEQINTLFADAKSRLASGAQKRNAGLAETYLDQCREALQPYADYRLRALACEEAIKLLTDISAYLGQKVATEERTGAVRWSGLIGEFQAGYDTVRATLSLLEDDVRRVTDAVNRPEAGMYLLVKGGDAGEVKVGVEEAKAWARFLDAEGGRRALFDKLRTNNGQMELLNRLRAVAANHLQAHEARIPPVADALRQMLRDDPQKLRELLTRMAARAMPWIQASFEVPHDIKGERYKLLIAVDRAAEFERDFGSLVREVIPPYGISVGYADSGVPGRIVCYCELAGVPLDVLVQLRSEWRQAYRKQDGANDAFPLHNHFDALRFPDPVAPRAYDVEQLSERMRLFLKGVGYGLLTRDPAEAGAGGQPSVYRVDMGGGDRQSIGSERTIRRVEFQSNHRERLESLIAAFEANLTPAKILGAQVVFEHMANRAYARRRELDANGREARYGGIGHHAAQTVAEQMKRHLTALGDLPPELADLEGARERLAARIDQFTRVVRHSVNDVDAYEANQDETDLAELRAVDKRQVDPARFTDELLLNLVGGGAAASPLGRATTPPPLGAVTGAPPPPPVAGPFHVFNGGAQRGPLPLSVLQAEFAAGLAGGDTQVYDEQRPQEGWRPAKLHPILAAVFAPPPPPPGIGGAGGQGVLGVGGPDAFYVAADGRTRGPLNSELLQAEVLAGLIGPATKVQSRPTHADLGWRKAAEHPATAAWFDIPPPPPD